MSQTVSNGDRSWALLMYSTNWAWFRAASRVTSPSINSFRSVQRDTLTGCPLSMTILLQAPGMFKISRTRAWTPALVDGSG